MTDRIKTPPRCHVDDVVERHRPAPWQHDFKLLQTVDAVALAVRQHHPDFDFIPVVRHDLHQLALIPGPQLSPKILHGESQRFAGWGQLENALLTPVGHVVLHAGDAGNFIQYVFQINRGGFHALKIRADDAHFKILPRRSGSRLLDGEIFEPCGFGNPGVPFIDELAVAHRPFVRFDQFDQY